MQFANRRRCFIYRAATLSEYVAKWSDEVHTLEANFSEARAHLIASIHDMQRKLEADAVVVCLSDPGVYWRRDIYPKYKPRGSPKSGQ